MSRDLFGEELFDEVLVPGFHGEVEGALAVFGQSVDVVCHSEIETLLNSLKTEPHQWVISL